MNKSSDILSEAAKHDAGIKSDQLTPLTESEFGATAGAARQTIHEGNSIPLVQAESQRFVEALLAAPGKPTQRFSQALKNYQGSVIDR